MAHTSSYKLTVCAYGTVIIVSGVIVLLIDILIGNQILTPSKRARIRHHVYHHTLAPNVAVNEDWGGAYHYELCTDENGFKSSCGTQTGKHFDIGFIGDSFTEGIGLPYEQTFVGMIAKTHPDWTIANLGVVSYSPTIYLAKVRYLLSRGYTFKKVHVYIDISDVHDEATYYDFQGERVAKRGTLMVNASFISFYENMRELFPLTLRAIERIKDTIVSPSDEEAFELERVRGSWSYNPTIKGYGPVGIEGGIKRAIDRMTELHELLMRHNITLSVGVYPWPAQLRYDKQESRQVSLWREYCRTRCEYFFDSFPAFYASATTNGVEKTINAYYFEGDIHFNEAGNRVLSENYLSTIARAPTLASTQ